MSSSCLRIRRISILRLKPKSACCIHVFLYSLRIRRISILRLKPVNSIQPPRPSEAAYELEESQFWDWNHHVHDALEAARHLRIRRISILRLKHDYRSPHMSPIRLRIRRISILRLKRLSGRLRVWWRRRYELEESQFWDWNVADAVAMLLPMSRYELEESQFWDWNNYKAHAPEAGGLPTN